MSDPTPQAGQPSDKLHEAVKTFELRIAQNELYSGDQYQAFKQFLDWTEPNTTQTATAPVNPPSNVASTARTNKNLSKYLPILSRNKLPDVEGGNANNVPLTEMSQAPDDGIEVPTVYELEPEETPDCLETEESEVVQKSGPFDTKGPQLVFIKGFPSRDCLGVLHEKCGMDPAFIRSHLATLPSFAGPHKSPSLPFSFTSPGLPSKFSQIVTVPLLTIIEDSGDRPRDTLLELQKKAKSEFMTYHEKLRQRSSPGDSIVRHFDVLSPNYRLVQQSISMTVISDESLGPSWKAIVWSDVGRDLAVGSCSRDGPWRFPENHANGTWNVHPIFLDEDVGKILEEKETASASTSDNGSDWRANQNVQHLARDYALLLDKKVMAQDSFYALSNTLRVSAASINQFLNLAAHLISEGSDESKGAGLKAPPMQQARTLQEVLSRTKRDLTRTVNFLSNRGLLQWPQAHNEDARARADRMASLLKMDFTDLSERANQFSADIQEWIDWLAQNATQSTANASQDSAQRTQKLTILAFMFVPVSTVCAFFGMNFEFVNEAPCMSFGITLGGTLIVSVIVWYALRWIMPRWAFMERVIYERFKQIRGGKKDE